MKTILMASCCVAFGLWANDYDFVREILAPPDWPSMEASNNILPVPRARNGVPVPTPRPSKKVARRLLCKIITNTDPLTYVHELAHCNGWTHPLPPTPYDPWVPAEFIHAYGGPLIVTIAGGGDDEAVRKFIQPDAKIVTRTETANALCKMGYSVLGCSLVPS